MWPSSATVRQFLRFLKIGVLNTLFGYALYALLLAAGLQMFVAQIVGTMIAIAFNYLTYSRYVFGGAAIYKMRFLFSYAVNYLISLASLATSAVVFPEPHLAGLVSMIISAAVNFLVLRTFVFAVRPGLSSNPSPHSRREQFRKNSVIVSKSFEGL